MEGRTRVAKIAFGTSSNERTGVLQYSDGGRIVVVARLPDLSVASVMIQIFSPGDVRVGISTPRLISRGSIEAIRSLAHLQTAIRRHSGRPPIRIRVLAPRFASREKSCPFSRLVGEIAFRGRQGPWRLCS